MSKHTPTPWNDIRVGAAGDGTAGSAEVQICNSEGRAVFIVRFDGSDEGLQNIAFMVTACSRHDGLLDALENIRRRAAAAEAAGTLMRGALGNIKDEAAEAIARAVGT